MEAESTISCALEATWRSHPDPQLQRHAWLDRRAWCFPNASRSTSATFQSQGSCPAPTTDGPTTRLASQLKVQHGWTLPSLVRAAAYLIEKTLQGTNFHWFVQRQEAAQTWVDGPNCCAYGHVPCRRTQTCGLLHWHSDGDGYVLMYMVYRFLACDGGRWYQSQRDFIHAIRSLWPYKGARRGQRLGRIKPEGCRVGVMRSPGGHGPLDRNEFLQEAQQGLLMLLGVRVEAQMEPEWEGIQSRIPSLSSNSKWPSMRT